MSLFNTTLIGGIQDISALLPLLGTDQVERHIGSALVGGFIYPSIAPITLFGSLGAVKLGFSVVTATIAYKSQRLKLVGAKWLSDAGFQPRGTVASLLGMERLSEKEEIYVAEASLLTMLEKRHIDNVDKLEVKWKAGFFRWNLKLLIFSLIFAAISILPYVFIFLHKERNDPVVPRWIFPVLRALGTAGIAVFSQVMTQIRVLRIIRNRIIFMTMEKRCPEVDFSTMTAGGWDTQRPSEECLWNLREGLKLHQQQSMQKFTGLPRSSTRSSPSLGEKHVDSHWDTVERTLKFEESRHPRIPGEHALLVAAWILIIPCMLLAVAGYVGSFNLVQSANTASGPLIWLGLEVALSLIRIVIWASNPERDDHPGLCFDLQLSPNPPLVTCNKFDNEIDEEKILPVSRSEAFLSEITTYVGPLETFNQGNISIYYTLTGCSEGHQEGERILYLTIYDYKEQASSVIVRRCDSDSWRYFRVGPVRWDVLQVTRGEEILPADNHFTSNVIFLQSLKEHCNDIARRLHIRKQPNIVHIFTDWTLKLRLDKPPSVKYSFPRLTQADQSYLQHGKKERESRHQYQLWSWWNEEHMKMVREELLRELPQATASPMASERREVNELEYLLATESAEMEVILVDEIWATEFALRAGHNEMTNIITSVRLPFEVSTQTGRKEEGKLTTERLTDERLSTVRDRTNTARDGTLTRLAREREAGKARMVAADYYRLYENEVKARWEKENQEVIPAKSWSTITADLGPPASDGDVDHAISQGLIQKCRDMMNRLMAESDAMKARFVTAEESITQTNDPKFRIDSVVACAAAKKRCMARQSMLEFRLEGERKLAKHKRLLFQRLESLDQDSARTKMASMLRLMRSKYTRYLDISNELIEATGGVEELTALLGLNTVTSVISVTADLNPEQADMVANAIQKMTNILTVSVWLDSPTLFNTSQAIATRVNGMEPSSEPTITYDYAFVTDHYRRDNPYMVLPFPEESRCTIRFVTTTQSSHKDLRLYHCPTTSGAKIDIILDDTVLIKDHGEGFYKDNFRWDTCRITNIPEGEHRLIVGLGDSPSVHWISDVDLADAEPSGHDISSEPRAEWIFDYPLPTVTGRF